MHHGDSFDPSPAKLVQPVEDPWLEALQYYAVGTLNLPICLGVCHDCLIHADMVIIAEIKELSASELRAIVSDDGVWDPKVMIYVSKEEHHLLKFDSRDWPSLDPL
jgi:hypothetical protein